MKNRPAILRRLVTVPALALFWLLTMALLPVLLITAIVIDLIRMRRGIKPSPSRMLAFLITYLTAELVAVLDCLVIWIASGFGAHRDLRLRWSYALQRVWANTLWGAACTFFSCDFP